MLLGCFALFTHSMCAWLDIFDINFIIDGWVFNYLYGWLLNYPTDLVKHKSISMSDFSKVFLKQDKL